MKENISVVLYSNNGMLGIIYEQDENSYTITTNLGFVGIMGASYVDINNVPEKIIAYLEEKGIMQKTSFTRQSGFVTYPLYYFNREKILEMNPENLDLLNKYEEDFEDNLWNNVGLNY